MLNFTQQCVVNALLARSIPFRYAEESVFGLSDRSFDGCLRAAWRRLGGVFLGRVLEPYIECDGGERLAIDVDFTEEGA